MEQVERRSSLLLVASLVLIGEKFVQPQDGSISDHHVSESVDISVDSVGNSDLVETALDELAESAVRARSWWLEFRELLKATVYNLRRSVRYP